MSEADSQRQTGAETETLKETKAEAQTESETGRGIDRDT